jgi:hypothetical protein
MNTWQIISTIIFYIMMGFLLLLLWRIAQNSAVNAQAMQVLSTVALKNAESVQKTAEANYILAKNMEKPPV